MSKLPSLITLTVIAALLAGCANASSEPDAQPAATETSSPSASPTAEETPDPVETQPEETAEETAEPSPEPPAAPVVEEPEEPAPDLEPLPAGPNDPFVPPPHGEPNPMAPTPHVDPGYFDNMTVEPVPMDHPAYGQHTTVVRQGATLTVVGSGYAAGQEIHVMLGWPNTDTNYILQPIGYANQNGDFSFPIVIGTNVPPRDYIVVTMPRVDDPEQRETLKRFGNVLITAQ